ncbi:Lrp/AsnC family transcriptional regulator [Candidatus Woesearchaeota archaeon]|nr:Lrp/AsnC family transcriptional regulator [Candidatus Woesearchaeota archaeon]
MDKKDMTILSCLRQDGRMSLTELSKSTGIPVSTAHDRLKHTQGFLFQKYTIVLNYSNIGFSTRAIIFVKSTSIKRDDLKDFLSKHPHINSLYSVNNDFDYCFECIFKDIGEMEFFIQAISDKFQIKKKEIHYILKEHSREKFFSDFETAKMMAEGNL